MSGPSVVSTAYDTKHTCKHAAPPSRCSLGKLQAAGCLTAALGPPRLPPPPPPAGALTSRWRGLPPAREVPGSSRSSRTCKRSQTGQRMVLHSALLSCSPYVRDQACLIECVTRQVVGAAAQADRGKQAARGFGGRPRLSLRARIWRAGRLAAAQIPLLPRPYCSPRRPARHRVGQACAGAGSLQLNGLPAFTLGFR